MVSRAKCSCVNCFWVPGSFALPLDFRAVGRLDKGFVDEEEASTHIFVGGIFCVDESSRRDRLRARRLRFIFGAAGDEVSSDIGEDGSKGPLTRAALELYVRFRVDI